MDAQAQLHVARQNLAHGTIGCQANGSLECNNHAPGLVRESMMRLAIQQDANIHSAGCRLTPRTLRMICFQIGTWREDCVQHNEQPLLEQGSGSGPDVRAERQVRCRLW